MEKTNQKINSDITISLKEMIDFDRYGAIKVESNRIIKFEEKKFYKKAYINCGVYLIKKTYLKKILLKTSLHLKSL